MGFFSWKTADTEEPIRNIHTGEHRTVFLLQPSGYFPIREDEYEGYGVFGGVSAHEWLARHNFPREELPKDSKLIRLMGIQLDCGTYCHDRETGTNWIISYPFHPKGFKHFAGKYDEVIPELGKTPNDLIREGRFVTYPVSNLFPIRYPLKFSFNPHAVYEELPPSKTTECQGYF